MSNRSPSKTNQRHSLLWLGASSTAKDNSWQWSDHCQATNSWYRFTHCSTNCLHLIICENACQDLAVAYVVDVVLAQLQFTGSSRMWSISNKTTTPIKSSFIYHLLRFSLCSCRSFLSWFINFNDNSIDRCTSTICQFFTRYNLFRHSSSKQPTNTTLSRSNRWFHRHGHLSCYCGLWVSSSNHSLRSHYAHLFEDFFSDLL